MMGLVAVSRSTTAATLFPKLSQTSRTLITVARSFSRRLRFSVCLVFRFNCQWHVCFRLNKQQFAIRNNSLEDKVTHAGVLEFIADEGRCYLPEWTMRTLGLSNGDLIVK